MQTSLELTESGVAHISSAGPSDYLQLLKPRVMSLVVFTALAGLLVAPVRLDPVLGLVSLIAIAVGAGAAGALNMWYDADIDAVMARTASRPIPRGTIARGEALAFGLTLAFLAVVTLGVAANWLAAALLAFTIFFYAVVYTMWLKRWTPQNIVIGGAAGAFPPVVAYAAAGGGVDLHSLLLFAIIFVWTPPHFWALALVKSGDYARAGVPMMPNVKGADHTRLEILLYTLVLVPLGVTPWLLGIGSMAYGVISIVAGAVLLASAVRVYKCRVGKTADTAAMQLFGLSILYLFLIFAALVAERLVAIAGWIFS
ncbi:MAG TPA: heme o synthase [Beijerinckiaceae bacterium]|nr:heme o synthase [Beijerinckiaceae bacterium]